MDRGSATSRVGALLAVAAFGGGLPGQVPALGSGTATCAGARSQQRAETAARFAEGRYRLESDGAAARAAVARFAADRVLAQAVQSGDTAAANAQALREVSGHHHITAIRVLRGNRVLLATERYPFDVAGAQSALRDRHGAHLGTVQVTIQDLIGFIRLVHKFTGSEVVVRGANGEAKSSLRAAATVRLPASGCATVAGRTYAVRSFAERSFTGEALTIWVLRGV